MIKKAIKIESVNVTKNMAQAREEFLLNCRARNLVNDTILNDDKVTKILFGITTPSLPMM